MPVFYVHALECSTCQSVWGANHQVSWGRGLGEQEGGGLHVEGMGVAQVTGYCWCGFWPLVTGYSDQVSNIKVPTSTYDWTLLCHRRGHYIGVRSESFCKLIHSLFFFGPAVG